MAAQCKHDYRAGNFPDRIKNSALEFVLEKLSAPFSQFFYFEAHSGPGKYANPHGEDYEGSSLRAYRILSSKKAYFRMILNEIIDSRRAQLNRNLPYGNVEVASDWQFSLYTCMPFHMHEPSLYYSDPSRLTDHELFLKAIPDIISSGANLMMYAPESFTKATHESIITNTRKIIKQAKAPSIELLLPSEKSGHFARIDHIFAIIPDSDTNQNQNLLGDLAANHKSSLIRESGRNHEISRRRMNHFLDKYEGGVI